MPAIEPADAFAYQLSADGHRGTRAIQRLVEYAPASGGLALWMQHRDVAEVPASVRFADTDNRTSHKPWVIGNDGKTIFYGPGFADRPLEEQTGLVAHQVLHVALRHADRERQLRRRIGQIDSELYAVCADAIVNASLSHLTWLRLPKGSVLLDQLLLHVLGIEQPMDVSLHQWNTEALYQAIDDRKHNAGSGQNRQTGQGSDGRSNHSSEQDSTGRQGTGQTAEHSGQSLSPNNPTPQDKSSNSPAQPDSDQPNSVNTTDGPKAHAARQLAASIIRDLLPASSESPETDTEQAMQWNERLLRAHASDGDQSFMRQLLADNTTPVTPWEQVLRTRVQRALCLQPDINWSRPTRSWIANRGRTAAGHRMPWQPGTSYSRNAPRLCILVDVSGSVDDQLMQRFANEIDRIIRTFKAAALLIIGDDKVRDEHTLEAGVSALRSVQFNGGGGTDFVPLINAANRFRPDIGLFLTDLDGPAGEAPNWPIIWAVPAQAKAQPLPYGRQIILD